MPPKAQKWDATAERDLSIAVFFANSDGRPSYNWNKVHDFFVKLGYDFTKDALSQHFTKIMLKDFKTRHGNLSPAENASPIGKTDKQAKSASKRKAAKAENLDDDDDDDDDDTNGDAESIDKSKKRKIQPQSENGSSKKAARKIGGDATGR